VIPSNISPPISSLSRLAGSRLPTAVAFPYRVTELPNKYRFGVGFPNGVSPPTSKVGRGCTFYGLHFWACISLTARHSTPLESSPFARKTKLLCQCLLCRCFFGRFIGNVDWQQPFALAFCTFLVSGFGLQKLLDIFWNFIFVISFVKL